MLRLAADENFNADVVRALRRRFPQIDLVRVQDFGLSGADDPTVLTWATRERRILLTHDVTTLVAQALRRVDAGQSMPGVFAVQSRSPLGTVIDDLALAAECSIEDEWEGRGALPAAVSLGLSSLGHRSTLMPRRPSGSTTFRNGMI